MSTGRCSHGHAYAAVIPAFVDALLRGRPVRIFGDGLQTRDFTYVGTVVKVLADAVLRKVTCPGPVNLAFGTRVPVTDLSQQLADIVGVPADIRYEAARAGDVRHSQAADGLLRSLFPDVAQVPLARGLAETVGWFRTLPEYAAAAGGLAPAGGSGLKETGEGSRGVSPRLPSVLSLSQFCPSPPATEYTGTLRSRPHTTAVTATTVISTVVCGKASSMTSTAVRHVMAAKAPITRAT